MSIWVIGIIIVACLIFLVGFLIYEGYTAASNALSALNPFKNSYANGVGVTAGCSGSASGYDAGLCYTPTRAGYTCAATTCTENCPPGYTDAGLFCQKTEQYGRGVGQTPSCGTLEYDAGLCYTPTEPGYTCAAETCTENCPSGFTDAGLFCQKPASYGRGAGVIPTTTYSNCPSGYTTYPLTCTNWSTANTMNRTATTTCSSGYELNGGLCYPVCKSGFHAVGCCVCSPDCPTGWTDTGTGCTKPTYSRGVGTLPGTCASGQELNGGLCYPECDAGYHAVGCCICSQDCPSGFADTGTGCTKPTYSRAIGTIPSTCPTGTQKDPTGLLCYPSCKTGYNMVGPLCTQS